MAIRSLLGHVLRANVSQCRSNATAQAVTFLANLGSDTDRNWQRNFSSAPPDGVYWFQHYLRAMIGI